MPRKVEQLSQDFSRGYDALKPYTADDDFWSPFDELKRLLNDPAVRQRIGNVIAKAAERSIKCKEQK
jgi:hypothetical protein